MDPTQIDKRTHSSLLFTPPNSSPSQSKHARHGMSTESSSSCCCGRLQCAYLQHNTTALDSLEKQLRSAAQLGQNLLIRHEAYVVSAEEERRQMAASIEKLEEEKKGLEVANAQIIEENRNLLDDLEGINTSLANSDAHIQSLTSALDSTRDELERLNILAARSSRLEAQLLEMETEQGRLQNQLVSTELDCRSATRRWKSAERTIATLHQYVDRIEEEARKEREKHEEVLLQFEQRRSVERELENAAGRLKGAAAVTRLGRSQGNDNEVTHFVTNILQDNAKLQMGIVELRTLLASSNEEIETLREQMLVHQPALPPNGHGIPQARLRTELALSSATESRSEFHIYHHYQSAGRLVRDKTRKVQRPRKARNLTSSELLTLRSGDHTLHNPSAPVMNDGSVATVRPKAVSSRSSPTHRWSTSSSQAQQSIAPSTVPSSPRSTYHNPSIFDTLDGSGDFSRPTSPESLSVESPRFSYHRSASDASFTNLPRQLRFEPKYSVPNDVPSQPAKQKPADNPDVPLVSSATAHETEDDLPTDPADASEGFSTGNGEPGIRTPPFRPQLHRSTSHESILAIPSHSFHQPPSHLFTNVMLPSCAVLTHTPATALPASHALRLSSSTYNRSLLSNLRGAPSSNTAGVSSNVHLSPASGKGKHSKQPPATLGKRVGGWVLGKWGVAPMTSTGDLRAQAKLSDGKTVRATGVNQKGSLKGLVAGVEKKVVRAEVQIGLIDEGLLQESLAET